MIKSLSILTKIRPICFCLIAVLLVSLCQPASAATKTRSKPHKAKRKANSARIVAASVPSPALYADIVIEADTGRILHETNAGARRHPASLTKMMTLYLAFQAIENKVLRLDGELPVSMLAANQSPSKLGLRAGQSIRTYDAIMGLVTQSANDAAVVLAEAVAGDVDQFAKMMVDQARTLGMRGTVFKNPNGLPNDEQVTTARDMAMLGHALVYHYPGFYSYFSRQNFTYKGRSYRNHNNLMKRYEGMDGIKTGYIRASGFNLVASAVRNNKRLIAVIFGGRSAVSRDGAMSKLLDQCFEDVGRGDLQQAQMLPLPSKVPTALALGGERTTEPSGHMRLAEGSSSGEQDPPRQEPIPAGAWGIQVGAFSSIDAAQQYLVSISRIMAPLLGGAEQSLQKVTMTDGSAVYRTRFIGVEQKTARTACAYMVKHGQSCLVVSGP